MEVPLYSWMTCRRRAGFGGGRAPAMVMAIDRLGDAVTMETRDSSRKTMIHLILED